MKNNLMSNLNRVIRHRARDESQFRVHFYIKYVYYDTELQPDQFLEAVSVRLAKIMPVACLQIASSSKRFADLSIGLQNEAAAVAFIDSGRRIMLPGENGGIIEHDLIMSQAFKAYYRAAKEGRNIGNAEKEGPKDSYKSDHSSSSSSYSRYNTPYPRRRERDHSRKRKHEDYRKKEEDGIRVSSLWIFCIPFEYKEREVCVVLSERNIRVKSYEWKLREDMEYLQAELVESVSLREIQALDCRLDKYPLLVLPRLQEQSLIIPNILKHELQLNFEKDIDEIQLIRTADRVGGVLLLVKDEYYGPRKYVIAFNNLAKVEQMTEEVMKKFKNCHCDKPKYAVRLGRVQRNFTFAQTIQNLAVYLQEM